MNSKMHKTGGAKLCYLTKVIKNIDIICSINYIYSMINTVYVEALTLFEEIKLHSKIPCF